MPSTILITGASGSVGSALTQRLLDRQYPVAHLVRSARKSTIPSFVWDIQKNSMDVDALKNTETIIHLAGAGVSEKRWSESWKKEILESRINSTRLLYNTLKNNSHQVKTFISASAIGYYGFTPDDQLFTEESKPGNDFLAQVVRDWEAEANAISQLGIRVVKIRIGIVLSKKGGALEQMALPVKLFAGAPLGTGKQYVSWIHMDDLCGIFIKALEDKNMNGAYNGVAPHPVTNREFTKAIARVLKRPVWPIQVPAFVLNTVVGEMANVIVNGSNVSSRKIEEAGYAFEYADVASALQNLL